MATHAAAPPPTPGPMADKYAHLWQQQPAACPVPAAAPAAPPPAPAPPPAAASAAPPAKEGVARRFRTVLVLVALCLLLYIVYRMSVKKDDEDEAMSPDMIRAKNMDILAKLQAEARREEEKQEQGKNEPPSAAETEDEFRSIEEIEEVLGEHQAGEPAQPKTPPQAPKKAKRRSKRSVTIEEEPGPPAPDAAAAE